MEILKVSASAHVLFLTLLTFSAFKMLNGQINTACTSSIFSTFTPCFNYLTGSSGNGSSPTEDCCNSLKSSMSDSIDCVCLMVTGNVPVSIPFIRTLALSLPQACNTGVPVQCSASGVPLPPPGPALFAPPPAPAPHHHHAPAYPPRHHRAAAFPPALAPRSQRVAKASAAPTAEVDPPVAAPTIEGPEATADTEKPTTSPPKSSLVPNTTPAGTRPVLQNPNTSTSAAIPSYSISSSLQSLTLIFIAVIILFIDKSMY
ncbi:uncharacterized protein LOC107822086 [Nicotiana tabacum]|uniref:Classical arabinogalactan protein 9-like n=1 Tax=Nicotiana tabacum TaxID=4097 RepID=A0A1S4CSS1_TOBAC|nr:PREDICTED: classical arabinogalactan protein 9-like [Nicotiana tabacum]